MHVHVCACMHMCACMCVCINMYMWCACMPAVCVILHLITLDHSILLAWLQDMFGISGQALKWFSSHLSDSVQAVSVNGWVSSQKKLH